MLSYVDVSVDLEDEPLLVELTRGYDNKPRVVISNAKPFGIRISLDYDAADALAAQLVDAVNELARRVSFVEEKIISDDVLEF